MDNKVCIKNICIQLERIIKMQSDYKIKLKGEKKKGGGGGSNCNRENKQTKKRVIRNLRIRICIVPVHVYKEIGLTVHSRK